MASMATYNPNQSNTRLYNLYLQCELLCEVSAINMAAANSFGRHSTRELTFLNSFLHVVPLIAINIVVIVYELILG